MEDIVDVRSVEDVEKPAISNTQFKVYRKVHVFAEKSEGIMEQESGGSLLGLIDAMAHVAKKKKEESPRANDFFFFLLLHNMCHEPQEGSSRLLLHVFSFA